MVLPANNGRAWQRESIMLEVLLYVSFGSLLSMTIHLLLDQIDTKKAHCIVFCSMHTSGLYNLFLFTEVIVCSHFKCFSNHGILIYTVTAISVWQQCEEKD